MGLHRIPALLSAIVLQSQAVLADPPLAGSERPANLFFDYGVPGPDGPYASTATADGNAVVAAYVQGTALFEKYLRMVTLNPAGQIVSEWTSAEQGRFVISDMLEDANGNIVVAGSLSSGTLANNDFSERAWVATYAPAGNLIWERSEWNETATGISSIALTANGIRIVGKANPGTRMSYGSVWFADLDSEGSILSERVVDFGDGESVSPVGTMTAGEDDIVFGAVITHDDWNTDAFVMRIDPNGGVIWRNRFGGPNWDGVSSATELSGGRIAVVGQISSSGSGYSDGWLVIFGPDGEIVQERTFGGALSDRFSRVLARPDGSLELQGETESKGSGDFDIWKVTIAADGTVVEDETEGTRLWDVARMLDLRGGEVLSVGQYVSPVTGDWNLWVGAEAPTAATPGISPD